MKTLLECISTNDVCGMINHFHRFDGVCPRTVKALLKLDELKDQRNAVSNAVKETKKLMLLCLEYGIKLHPEWDNEI